MGGLAIKHKGSWLPKSPPQHEWWPRMLHPWSFLGNVWAVIALRTSFPAVVYQSHPWRGEGSRQPPSVLLLEWKKWIQGRNNDLPYCHYPEPSIYICWLCYLLVISPCFQLKIPCWSMLLFIGMLDHESVQSSVCSAVDLWPLMSLSPSHPGSCMFASLLRNRVLESWET